MMTMELRESRTKPWHQRICPRSSCCFHPFSSNNVPPPSLWCRPAAEDLGQKLGMSSMFGPKKIRPHRRCWGVIFRMALVKGYRFYLGGWGIFRPKPPVFDRSWRSPSKNTVKNSTEDTCSWTRPSKIGKRKVKKTRVFQLFDFNFLVCNIFFCGSAGGLARRRILSFWTRFRTDFRRFVIAETLVFSVFLFSACLTASFKTSKNLVNYAVLCYGVNENIVNTSVFWRWLKKHCKLQCFWPPDPQKPWYLQWFLLLTAQKHCK